jgi:hypothetical protein
LVRPSTTNCCLSTKLAQPSAEFALLHNVFDEDLKIREMNSFLMLFLGFEPSPGITHCDKPPSIEKNLPTDQVRVSIWEPLFSHAVGHGI